MANWPTRAYWNAFTLWHARRERELPFEPLEKIREVQSRRVRSMVAHAYATVPYYRQVMDAAGWQPRDFQTADDLAKLPLLTSDQVLRNSVQFRSLSYPASECVTLLSGGSTGMAKHIAYDRAALFLSLAHGQRQRHVLAQFVGQHLGYREMTVERVGGDSTIIRQFYETNSWVPRRFDYARALLPTMISLDEGIARINAFKPDVLRGYGSMIGYLFRRAHEQNSPIHLPKAVVYGADSITQADRELIEKEFGVPVLSSYQATEALRIGYQCERRAGFHLSLDQIAIRVVDPAGNSVRPGESGEIAISNLTNRAMVLLNYQIGDAVTLSAAGCRCGRTFPTIETISPSSSDRIVLADGRVVRGILLPILAVAGTIQVQLIQDELNRFTLRVVYEPTEDWERVRQELDTVLRQILRQDSILDIVAVDTIPPERNGKVKAVISKVLHPDPQDDAAAHVRRSGRLESIR